MNSASESSGRPIHSNWFLSFGDLLTLLLCFFLTILSFSPLNPNRELGSVSEKSQTVTAGESLRAAGGVQNAVAGTALANLGLGDEKATLPVNASVVEGLRFWFEESDFVGLGWELSEQSAGRLKNQVVGTAYATKRVTIESCLEAAAVGEETAWAGSISRILTLRSQLIDAGIPAGLFRYRVLGPYCNEVRAVGSQETARPQAPVSRISIEFETKHG